MCKALVMFNQRVPSWLLLALKAAGVGLAVYFVNF